MKMLKNANNYVTIPMTRIDEENTNIQEIKPQMDEQKDFLIKGSENRIGIKVVGKMDLSQFQKFKKEIRKGKEGRKTSPKAYDIIE